MNFGQLENFQWVIPGVFYIYYYNTFTPHKKIIISGWPYLFTIVIIAFIHRLPNYFLDTDLITEKYTDLITEKHIENLKKLFQVGLYTLLLWLPRIEWVKQFLPQIEDYFYNKCVEWHKKAILLTLESGKVYVGYLWKYPNNPHLKYESQTISIIPSFSGYREKEQKRIEWTTYYPIDKFNSDMELIIPRSEIVTFCKFNQEVHTHFETKKEFNKKYPFATPPFKGTY